MLALTRHNRNIPAITAQGTQLTTPFKQNSTNCSATMVVVLHSCTRLCEHPQNEPQQNLVQQPILHLSHALRVKGEEKHEQMYGFQHECFA